MATFLTIPQSFSKSIYPLKNPSPSWFWIKLIKRMPIPYRQIFNINNDYSNHKLTLSVICKYLANNNHNILQWLSVFIYLKCVCRLYRHLRPILKVVTNNFIQIISGRRTNPLCKTKRHFEVRGERNDKYS